MDVVSVNPTGPGNAQITVALHGGIDAADTAHLRDVLIDVIMRRRPEHIVVDLRQVTELDSSAIGTLRAAYHTARDMHQRLDFQTGAATDALRLPAQAA